MKFSSGYKPEESSQMNFQMILKVKTSETQQMRAVKRARKSLANVIVCRLARRSITTLKFRRLT